MFFNLFVFHVCLLISCDELDFRIDSRDTACQERLCESAFAGESFDVACVCVVFFFFFFFFLSGLFKKK